MPYYVEEEMTQLRQLFEDEVLRWPEVTTRKMFGCPSYQVKDRLFAFLVTGGVVITNLVKNDRDRLAESYTVAEFKAGERVVKYWVQVEISDRRALGFVLPYVRKSYETAIDRALGKA
ncbi:MAG: hypothetical protein JXB35_14240 [Anaerolineae bacterium]|nr:hypothetical protein [Anaerolineae bacterium]